MRYQPTLVAFQEGMEQAFEANVVHVEDDLIAFGDLIADAERGLPYGTPVHSLLIHIEDGRAEAVELNDQGNTVPAEAIARLDIARDHVRVIFRPAAGPFAGRVSLSPEIEIFEDVPAERFDNVQLGALRIGFSLDDARFEALRAGLARLFT